MYPLPVIKLAGLGAAREYRRGALRTGETMLLEALHMAGAIVQRTGLGIAVVTDPLTPQSERFFRKYGFKPMGRTFGQEADAAFADQDGVGAGR